MLITQQEPTEDRVTHLEEPLDADEPVAPNRITISLLWPGEYGWSATLTTRDWSRLLTDMSAKWVTRADRAEFWDCAKRQVTGGYEKALATAGAEGGHHIALATAIAACLSPQFGSLTRSLLKQQLDRHCAHPAEGSDQVIVAVLSGGEPGRVQ